MDDFGDFNSSDPFERYNAHQAAKGRLPLPDPDELRKRDKEQGLMITPDDIVILDRLIVILDRLVEAEGNDAEIDAWEAIKNFTQVTST